MKRTGVPNWIEQPNLNAAAGSPQLHDNDSIPPRVRGPNWCPKPTHRNGPHSADRHPRESHRGALSQVRQQQPLLEMCDVIEFRSLVSSQLRAILAQHCCQPPKDARRKNYSSSFRRFVGRADINQPKTTVEPSKMIRSRSLIALSKSARLGDLAASESFVASADRS